MALTGVTKLEQTERLVTVFGGSRCGPDAPEYVESIRLGRALVEAGYAVCSGGYSGIMEGVSRGAHEAGGHVIGVTMSQLRSSPNPYLKKIMPTADFYSRLQEMIRQSSGYVAMRGGMGTMTELSLVWNKLMTGVISGKPLILLGGCWEPVISCLRQHLVISEADVAHLCFAQTAEEAVAVLVNTHSQQFHGAE